MDPFWGYQCPQKTNDFRDFLQRKQNKSMNIDFPKFQNAKKLYTFSFEVLKTFKIKGKSITSNFEVIDFLLAF